MKKTHYADGHDRYMSEVVFKDKLFNNTNKELLQRFAVYHKKNTSIYHDFKELAFQMISADRAKYSAWVVVNVIRWRRDSKSNNKLFKINNDFIAIYARMFAVEFPQYKDFFVTRKMKPIRSISQEERARINDEENLLN